MFKRPKEKGFTAQIKVGQRAYLVEYLYYIKKKGKIEREKLCKFFNYKSSSSLLLTNNLNFNF